MKSDVLLIDVDLLGQCDEFKEIMGYVNTEKGKQLKGALGYAK